MFAGPSGRSEDVGGGSMGRFYKPSFSQDPWAQLESQQQSQQQPLADAGPLPGPPSHGQPRQTSGQPQQGGSLADLLESSLAEAMQQGPACGKTDDEGLRDRPWH